MLYYSLKILDELDAAEEAERLKRERINYKTDTLSLVISKAINLAIVLGLSDLNPDSSS